MITITIHNEETGAYVDGVFEFGPDRKFGPPEDFLIEAFLDRVEPNITIGHTYGIFGDIEVTSADIGSIKKGEE